MAFYNNGELSSHNCRSMPQKIPKGKCN